MSCSEPSPAQRLARRLFPTTPSDSSMGPAYVTAIKDIVYPLFSQKVHKWEIFITKLADGYYWSNVSEQHRPGTKDILMPPRLNCIPLIFISNTLKAEGFTVSAAGSCGIKVALPIPTSYTDPDSSPATPAEKHARQLFPATVSDSTMGPTFKTAVEETIFPLFEAGGTARREITITYLSDGYYWYDTKDQYRPGDHNVKISSRLNSVPLIFITNTLMAAGFEVVSSRSGMRVTLPT